MTEDANDEEEVDLTESFADGFRQTAWVGRVGSAINSFGILGLAASVIIFIVALANSGNAANDDGPNGAVLFAGGLYALFGSLLILAVGTTMVMLSSYVGLRLDEMERRYLSED